MKWYTSDTHFWHKNIIKYSNRPFNSVEEMNEELIKRWNQRVKPDDEVYHLGDFGFAPIDKLQSIFNQLNGKKYFIKGNHDKEAVKLPWIWVKERVELYDNSNADKIMLVLSHYSHRVWNKAHHGSIMLYGHSHGSLEGDSQTLDVGVDCWEYAPVCLDEIKKRLNTLTPRKAVDHHGE